MMSATEAAQEGHELHGSSQKRVERGAIRKARQRIERTLAFSAFKLLPQGTHTRGKFRETLFLPPLLLGEGAFEHGRRLRDFSPKSLHVLALERRAEAG
jgi:hypothetical protein